METEFYLNDEFMVDTRPAGFVQKQQRSRNWEGLLHEMLPLDFPPERACYVLPAFAISREFWEGNPAFAYTNCGLDLRLKPQLEEMGEWRGRGFCVVLLKALDFVFRLSEAEQTGLILHEFSHHLDDDIFFQTVGLRADQVENVPPKRTPLPTTSEFRKRPWDSHEDRFTRIALHLRHRAALAGWECTPFQLHIAGENYGMSDPDEYAAALGDEPERRINERILDIIETSAPAAFTGLFEADVRRYYATTFQELAERELRAGRSLQAALDRVAAMADGNDW